jgi:putative endonuclease
MNYYLYILQSLTNDRFYVGHTNNLERRLKEHNSGQTKSTKPHIPWELVFSKTYNNKSDANKAELFIKKKKSKIYIQNLICNKTKLPF